MPFLEDFFGAADRQIETQLCKAKTEDELRLVQSMAVFKSKMFEIVNRDIRRGEEAAKRLNDKD